MFNQFISEGMVIMFAIVIVLIIVLIVKQLYKTHSPSFISPYERLYALLEELKETSEISDMAHVAIKDSIEKLEYKEKIDVIDSSIQAYKELASEGLMTIDDFNSHMKDLQGERARLINEKYGKN